MSILLLIVVLGILILSHEFGHFIVAKKSGVRVDEFGFGFPPRLFSFTKGETTYSLNLLPFGGFVKIFGENPDEESLTGRDSSRSLTGKSRSVQAAVLVAGVVCNLLLAWIFLSVGFMIGMPVSTQSGFASEGEARLIITSINPGSPAELAGLKPGDQILSLADERGIMAEDPNPEIVSTFIAAHPTEDILLSAQRGEATLEFKLRPADGLVQDRAAIGIVMDEVTIARSSFFVAFIHGAEMTARLTIATVFGLWQLIAKSFTGESVLANITGPVGLVGLVSDAALLGFVYLLSFTAFISINLAVLNLVPFPALDGGRLLFLLIEKIKGSPIRPQVANFLNLVGFGLLLLLMLVVTYGDIRRLLF
ncbi:RIP metalloprotease RseP [Candidatus Nomurabacteria bacterium]|nr:RIP metalloprotease RseP [Candidatus Nomurabacteria bacterium]